jgi:hypothetical protein
MGISSKNKVVMGILLTVIAVFTFGSFYSILLPAENNHKLEASCNDPANESIGAELYRVFENINEEYLNITDNYQGSIVVEAKTSKKTIKYKDGSKYVGQISNGKRNGTGTMYYTNGDKYSGKWKNDYYNGKGTYKFDEGITLKGTFNKNGLVNGKYMYYDDDGEYTITIKNKKATGEVIAEMYTGNKYTGTYKNDAFNGEVKIVYDNDDVYSGSVVEGLKSGIGKYKWDEGDWYQGNWANDMMSGTGEYHFSSDTYPYFTAEFSSNKPNGTSTYYQTSSKTYTATWTDGICTELE